MPLFFYFEFLVSKCIFQFRSRDPNMTYFWQLALYVLCQQNWPAIIPPSTISPYATAKGHPPHKYVIYSQTKVNIAESIENCVHLKLFDLIVNTQTVNCIRGSFCLRSKKLFPPFMFSSILAGSLQHIVFKIGLHQAS